MHKQTAVLLLCAAARHLAAEEAPASWIDPDTGHRMVRLTTEPGSASLYFNQNCYTAGGRKFVYLSRPELLPGRGLDEPVFVKPGVLRAERLVNMAKHNYRLEPNVSFTPDQKWVVFRSNMFGTTYVFAVEVAKR